MTSKSNSLTRSCVSSSAYPASDRGARRRGRGGRGGRLAQPTGAAKQERPKKKEGAPPRARRERNRRPLVGFTMSCGKKVCVIGGGTSGLAGMVQLLDEGIEARARRRRPDRPPSSDCVLIAFRIGRLLREGGARRGHLQLGRGQERGLRQRHPDDLVDAHGLQRHAVERR